MVSVGHLRVRGGRGDVRTRGVAGVTMSRPGGRGRRTGARRGCSPSPRCARRRARPGRRPGRAAPRSGRSRPAVARTVSSTASKRGRRSTAARRVGIGPEQLPQRPQGVEGRLRLRVRQAVPSPSRTTQLRRVVAVVGELVDALGGDRGEHRVGGATTGDSNSASRQVENISSRTTSSAKSRSACSASRTFLKSFSSRKNASWSSVWPRIAARPGRAACAPGRAGRARCWRPRSPLPARAGGPPTAAAGGCRSARRRRGRGSSGPARAASRPSGTDVSMPSSGSVNPVPNAQR